MEAFKIFTILFLISSVLCGSPSPCEPFVSNFQAFLQAWLNLVDHYQKLVIDISSENPIFTTSLVENLKCQTNGAIELAGNAISRLSGVNHTDIASILNGTLAPESGTTIDCIISDIIYMQQRVLTIFDDMVPLLESSVYTESTPNDCDEVFTRLEPFIEVGNIVSKRIGELLRHNRQAFMSIGMEDLYIQDLISQTPCFYKIIGIGLGSLLNSDGSVVSQYFYNEDVVLSYPFSCIEPGLNFVKSSFNQSYADLYYGKIASIDFNIPN